MDADAFIKAVSPLLKEHGFKKSSATWRKDQGESVAVFNIQKSQWGGGASYVNLGRSVERSMTAFGVAVAALNHAGHQ